MKLTQSRGADGNIILSNENGVTVATINECGARDDSGHAIASLVWANEICMAVNGWRM